jgi:hypothetical protein
MRAFVLTLCCLAIATLPQCAIAQGGPDKALPGFLDPVRDLAKLDLFRHETRGGQLGFL